jgi:hypothetical protein
MPELLLHVGAMAACPDGGQMSINSSNTRVKLEGQFASTLTDLYKIAGCSANPPCLAVFWQNPATRLKINGSPAILKNSSGFTNTSKQIKGLNVLQTRVKGT